MNEAARAARNRAIACIARSAFAEAADLLRQAVEIEPASADLWGDLGAVEHQLGNLEPAAVAYERSLALAPGRVGTLANFGYLLARRGEAERALAMLQGAVNDTPQAATVWIAVGHAHWVLNDLGKAEAAFRRAMTLAPEDASARQNLAAVLRSAWKLSEAEAVCRDLLATCPQYPHAWATLGEIQLALGQAAAATSSYRRAVELSGNAQWHSDMLLSMQYAPGVDPLQLKEAHQAWEAAYARRLLPRAENRRPPALDKRPLRIGFLSSQFRRHPTAFLVLPAVAAMDREQATVICYSDGRLDDEYTARFRAAAAFWRQVTDRSDEQLAAQIREDDVDVLVDLTGHTSSRLLVFARKPAALQISWLGYVGTTGLAAMDGLVADAIHVREGEEPYYIERVLRMPCGYACYAAPPSAPDVSPLPALAAGHITFGCFNNPAKFNDALFDAWSAILARVPGSRLLLKFLGLNDERVRARLHKQFERRGIALARIIIEGQAEHQEFLANYGRVDIALDTQPYSGGLTTCEALWMGVPVVTFPGRTFAGRHAASHLTAAGFAHFVASDWAGYVNCAVSWARQPEALAALRSRMREQMRASPLCDAEGFARDFLKMVVAAHAGLSAA